MEVLSMTQENNTFYIVKASVQFDSYSFTKNLFTEFKPIKNMNVIKVTFKCLFVQL